MTNEVVVLSLTCHVVYDVEVRVIFPQYDDLVVSFPLVDQFHRAQDLHGLIGKDDKMIR